MKKGFTLVEMLIVVVVVVTLMTMTFRLSSIGDDSRRRNSTVVRMSRLENCLSGYNAAFGSYPPVKLHASRNVYLTVNDYGIQTGEINNNIWNWNNIGESNEANAWEQVKAACQAQPVACRFPFPKESEYNEMVKSISESIQQTVKDNSKSISEKRKKVLSQPFDNGVTDNIGRHDRTKSEWQDSQLFMFGLMSYLLPRYLVMMRSDETFFRGGYAQWEMNNAMPCNPMTGERFNGWQVVQDLTRADQASQLAQVANIPSQAVTARWMPNLEGIVSANHAITLFGIDIRDCTGNAELRADNTDIAVFSPGGRKGQSGSGYILDSVTVIDGWGSEYYYYSPPPYQTYTLWSSGANRRTFPPWISRKGLSSDQNKKVGLWVEDDIVRMSN